MTRFGDISSLICVDSNSGVWLMYIFRCISDGKDSCIGHISAKLARYKMDILVAMDAGGRRAPYTERIKARYGKRDY